MFRSAALLLIVGLAVGLWLGFDPQAHKQTMQYWDKAQAAFLQIKASANLKVNSVNTHLAVEAKPSPKLQPQASTTNSPSFNTAWKEIVNGFETLWLSFRTAWVNIEASIKNIKL